MILETTGKHPTVNGHRIRYVSILRDGEYGCNDTVYDWDGWNKEKDRPAILELLHEAARCRYTKFGPCGASYQRQDNKRRRTESVCIGYYDPTLEELAQSAYDDKTATGEYCNDYIPSSNNYEAAAIGCACAVMNLSRPVTVKITRGGKLVVTTEKGAWIVAFDYTAGYDCAAKFEEYKK